MGGGTARDFSDEARGTLAPGAKLRGKDWMLPFHGTRGLTSANRDVAVCFHHARLSAAFALVKPAANDCLAAHFPGASVSSQSLRSP
jgi:hypothetical protein